MLAFLLTHPLLSRGQLPVSRSQIPLSPPPPWIHAKETASTCLTYVLVRRNMTFVPSFILYIYVCMYPYFVAFCELPQRSKPETLTRSRFSTMLILWHFSRPRISKFHFPSSENRNHLNTPYFQLKPMLPSCAS